MEVAEVRKQLDKYLSKGWIGPSSSLYGAPFFIVGKKDGTLRMCIYYRALNQQIKPNKYSLPRIDSLLDQLVISKYFISINLYTIYHQVIMYLADEYKIAFLSSYSLFEFILLPFGLINAPLYILKSNE